MQNLSFKLLAFAALLYLIFALLHHHRDKSLKFEIIIEYVLLAALAFIIIL